MRFSLITNPLITNHLPGFFPAPVRVQGCDAKESQMNRIGQLLVTSAMCLIAGATPQQERPPVRTVKPSPRMYRAPRVVPDDATPPPPPLPLSATPPPPSLLHDTS